MEYKNVKKGDKVVVFEGTRGCESVHTVTRVTKKQIILKMNNREVRFARDTGYLLNDKSLWHSRWRITSIREKDIAIVEQAKRKEMLLSKISGINWRSLSNDKLESVLQIAEKPIQVTVIQGFAASSTRYKSC